MLSDVPPPNAPQIDASWLNVLRDEFQKPYFADIKQFLLQQKQQGITIYPSGQLIFNAFNLSPFDQTKVVILGQDPYHGQGQAMGLSFSVPDGVKPPPSLVNIYKELESDISGFVPPRHGNLSAWARQGVFLLNAILTVEAGKAASHQRIGWQHFTDAAIDALSQQREGLVFMLWGNFAKAKRARIDTQKHLVLEAAHPSPLAGNAFSGCRHFSQTNAYLVKQGLLPIDWTL